MRQALTTQIEIAPSVRELLVLMRNNEFAIDQNDLSLGKKTVLVYEADTVAAESFETAKQMALMLAIEDLAAGAPTLLTFTIGVKLSGKRPEVFTRSHLELLPLKDVVFSIQLKEIVSVAASREAQPEMHSQTAYAAMYYLIYLASRLAD